MLYYHIGAVIVIFVCIGALVKIFLDGERQKSLTSKERAQMDREYWNSNEER